MPSLGRQLLTYLAYGGHGLGPADVVRLACASRVVADTLLGDEFVRGKLYAMRGFAFCYKRNNIYGLLACLDPQQRVTYDLEDILTLVRLPHTAPYGRIPDRVDTGVWKLMTASARGEVDVRFQVFTTDEFPDLEFPVHALLHLTGQEDKLALLGAPPAREDTTTFFRVLAGRVTEIDDYYKRTWKDKKLRQPHSAIFLAAVHARAMHIVGKLHRKPWIRTAALRTAVQIAVQHADTAMLRLFADHKRTVKSIKVSWLYHDICHNYSPELFDALNAFPPLCKSFSSSTDVFFLWMPVCVPLERLDFLHKLLMCLPNENIVRRCDATLWGLVVEKQEWDIVPRLAQFIVPPEPLIPDILRALPRELVGPSIDAIFFSSMRSVTLAVRVVCSLLAAGEVEPARAIAGHPLFEVPQVMFGHIRGVLCRNRDKDMLSLFSRHAPAIYEALMLALIRPGSNDVVHALAGTPSFMFSPETIAQFWGADTSGTDELALCPLP